MLVDSVAVGFDEDDLARSESVSEKKLEIEEGGEQKERTFSYDAVHLVEATDNVHLRA